MSLLQTIEDRLIALLSPIFKPIRALVDLIARFRDSTTGLLNDSTDLIKEVLSEYEQIKNFQEKPQWRNRVISVPHVIENAKQLAEVPSTVATAIRDLVAQLKSQFPEEAFNVNELEGIDDLRGLFGKLGRRVAAGFEKVLGIAALVLSALESVRATVTDLKSIVDSIRTVREDLENLDLIFLQQKNPRKRDQLKDGTPIALRIGNLHS